MIFVIFSAFIAALILLWTGKYFRGKRSVFLAVLPIGIFLFLMSQLPPIIEGKTLLFSYPWIPSLGVDLDFRVDGLSMLFGLLISGIGALIFIYASSYLKGSPYLDRFLGYLCVFMGSMLGLVFSDNLILLFIFWELTSISSFFLIAYENKKEEARKSALVALAITGGGGFFLLAGIVLVGAIFDSYSFETILQSGRVAAEHPLYAWLLFLFFAGAFTKSAQFPFHFWLPGAMAAPTPVSAYLHSATMVKAGIFLIMRFTPVLGDTQLWSTTLLIVGGVTMLFGALHSILRTDLKAVLAYSTVAALGILVFLLGVGTEEAYIACVVFILVHALYKAALFLIVGAIDHETGTRDVTRLSGLGKVLLPLAVAGFVAAFSGSGVPLTFGFIGKDLIYEATLGSQNAIFFTVLAVLTNVFLLYAAFIAGIKPFTGKLSPEWKDLHAPSAGLWIPPAILSTGSLAAGLFPAYVDAPLIKPALFAMQGLDSGIHLKIWHGFNLVLLLSAITLVSGLALYLLFKPGTRRRRLVAPFDRLAPERILSMMSVAFEKFSLRYTRLLQNGHLRSYLITIILFLVGVVSYKLFTEVNIIIGYDQISRISAYEGLVFTVMVGAIFKTLQSQSRLTAIVAMSVVGYCMCLLFVFFSAPDLAMTQFAIDTLTIVLFVLVLLRLPPFLKFSNNRVKIRDGLISLSFGLLISIIALQVLIEPTQKMISRYYADNAYLTAKGKNVVNVILVDFRGFDTLVEITVLTIAAIGVYSLLKLTISSSETE